MEEPVSGSHVAGTTTHRVAWGLLDQGVAAASNLVVVLLAARSLAPAEFGVVAVALTVYAAAIFLARGVSSDPLTTAHADEARAERSAAVQAAAATSLATSLGVALVTVMVALALGGGAARGTLLAVAVLLPGLALQDYLRFVLILEGKAKLAFVNDLFWLVCQIPFILGALWLGWGAAGLILAWGLGGNLAALLGLRQARTGVGRLRSVRPWLRRHRDLWPYFVTENLVYQATILILVVVISLSASLADVGAFRAAMLLYSPLANVGRGVLLVAVPELARRRGDPRTVRRMALLLAWLLTAFAMLWAILMPLIPDHFGRGLLGDTWPLAKPLLFLAGASAAASLFSSGAAAGIRALGAGAEGLTARTVVSILVLICASAGGIVDGAYGVMLALALSTPLQILTWWRLLVRASKRTDRIIDPDVSEAR